jgi:hypothetical protein
MNNSVTYKILKILSDGSLSFNFYLNSKQFLLNEKDNKNFNLNKKNSFSKIQVNKFSNYKKKYFI